MNVYLWNLTGTSAAVLPKCLSNFRAIGQLWRQISWLRDFMRSYDKTSHRILKRDPGLFWWGNMQMVGMLFLLTANGISRHMVYMCSISVGAAGCVSHFYSGNSPSTLMMNSFALIHHVLMKLSLKLTSQVVFQHFLLCPCFQCTLWHWRLQ